MSDRYRIGFKSHRLSERVYTLEADGKGTAHFVAAALRNANWFVNEPPTLIKVDALDDSHGSGPAGGCSCGRAHGSQSSVSDG